MVRNYGTYCQYQGRYVRVHGRVEQPTRARNAKTERVQVQQQHNAERGQIIRSTNGSYQCISILWSSAVCLNYEYRSTTAA